MTTTRGLNTDKSLLGKRITSLVKFRAVKTYKPASTPPSTVRTCPVTNDAS